MPVVCSHSGSATAHAARVLLCLASLSGSIIIGCRGEENKTGLAPASRAVAVTTDKATRKSMPIVLTAVGSVEASAVVSIQSQVSGELQKVHFSEGDTVKKGQLLFTIDRRPFDVAVQEAVAQRQRNQALADNAKRELDRYESLLADNYVSKEDYERAKANYLALQASLRADRSSIQAASIRSQYATIRSPIDGRTGSLLVYPGNIVSPGGNALVVVRQTLPASVRFAIPEVYVDAVRERMRIGRPPVEASTRGATPVVEHGELSLIENTVDTATGTIDLKAEFANKEERLWPGQFVDVVLRLSVEDNALVVPAVAVQQGREGLFVYVVSNDGLAELRYVKVMRTVDFQSVIGGGLEAGETVVTDGHMMLANGTRVTIKPSATKDSARAVGGTGGDRKSEKGSPSDLASPAANPDSSASSGAP